MMVSLPILTLTPMWGMPRWAFAFNLGRSLVLLTNINHFLRKSIQRSKVLLANAVVPDVQLPKLQTQQAEAVEAEKGKGSG